MMAPSKTPKRLHRSRRRTRRWNFLVLAGLPLFALHLWMLVERANHQETLDPFIAFRWMLAVALLVVLKRTGFDLRSLRSPSLGLAAILIFTLIHAPAVAPDPGLPLAVTGLGLALSLAVVDRQCGALTTGLDMELLVQPESLAVGPGLCRETLKNRAPPVSR